MFVWNADGGKLYMEWRVSCRCCCRCCCCWNLLKAPQWILRWASACCDYLLLLTLPEYTRQINLFISKSRMQLINKVQEHGSKLWRFEFAVSFCAKFPCNFYVKFKLWNTFIRRCFVVVFALSGFCKKQVIYRWWITSSKKLFSRWLI